MHALMQCKLPKYAHKYALIKYYDIIIQKKSRFKTTLRNRKILATGSKLLRFNLGSYVDVFHPRKTVSIPDIP